MKEVNLIFKKSNDSLVAYISVIEDGTLVGVSGRWEIPKTEVTPPAEWNLRPYVKYKCSVVRNDDGGFDIIGATPIRYNVSMYRKTHDCGSRFIVAQIGNRRIYLDPTYGKSDNSRTLDGAIRAINMVTNNFDKISAIKEITSHYDEWILPGINKKS